MEVVAMNGNAPFKREVHEWKHIDAKTGAMLSGRAEANRYVNGNINTYGKSLLQSLETSDGTQHKQHKQMNILQTITPTGSALQVVRAQTIQTSHSSSRRAIATTTYSHYTNGGTDNHPPPSSSSRNGGGDLLSIIPRTLHHQQQQQQHHETTAHSPTAEISSRMKALLSSSHFNVASHTSNTAAHPNDSHLFHHHHHANNDIDLRLMKNKFDVGLEKKEQSRQQQMNEMLYGNGMSKESFGFLRGKSASIEELANIDDDDDDLKPYEWKRVSKIRRSLQFPTTETKRINYHHRPSRPADLPENSVNVWKIKQDIENGCKLQQQNTAMKTAVNPSGDFVALDSILKDSGSPMDSLNSNLSDTAKDDCLTAESLQDIRRRLRKMKCSNVTSNGKFNRPFVPSTLSAKEQKFSLEQNCKSLELRKNRERDTNAEDWLNRRKSYGFEKMHQPSESLSGNAVESSVDSGLGLSRSSDLPSNWSPTNSAGNEPQRTIITFGNDKSKPATSSISLFNHASAASDKPIPMRRSTVAKKADEDLKRHSIAIDEKVDEHYQQKGSPDRKISLVNLNGQYDELKMCAIDGRQKKVEFCKTEIHFAADSGRVNIVETNTKPPPTNNFRRRRRPSGGSASLDSEYPSKAQQQELQIDDDAQFESFADGGKVTTTIGSVYDNIIGGGSLREDCDTDEGHSEDGLRGILKNKPIKPKPYHLGENLESGSSLWGVRLKPVENQHTTWRHSAELESVVTTKKSEDALETEFKNLVMAMDEKAAPTSNHNQFQSTVSSNGYSTKINLSSLPAIQQQHPAASTASIVTKDTTSSLFATTSHIPPPSTTKTTFTSFTDSRQSTNNGNRGDKDQPQHKGHHKISIDLNLPHPSSMDTIMDELKSTSLIIKTMKSTSFFDDAMKHLERESPFIRSSSLRLANEALPKSSSTSSMLYRHKPNPPAHRYSSSLDGDRGILDDNSTSNNNNNVSCKSRDDDFDFLNGFLEENRKFQLSIAQRQQVKEEEKEVKEEEKQPPIAAPRLKKIMNSSQQLSQQLSQLRHLYDNANDSDDNAKADEEVKSFLSKSEEEKSTELSGSWSRVRVKKIANAFQQSTPGATTTTNESKWQRTPLTSLYENSTTTTSSSSSSSVKVPLVEPRTSLIQIGANHEKVNSNIYSNVQQQDNSVKVNIQNFESLTPSLSRSNSLRVKKEDLTTTPKISPGTRQLKAHELTYFGIKSASPSMRTTQRSHHQQETSISKSSFVHLSNGKANTNPIINTITTTIANTKSPAITTSKVIINHHQQKPDLIMHHHQHTPMSSVTPELTSSEKKSMIEALDSCIDETKNLEPLYENLYQQQNNNAKLYDRKSDLKRDEKILSELSRAADEIMETCKEMYQHDTEEKKRKSQLLSNGTTCLETINEGSEGRQRVKNESGETKSTRSKGVQVSRNFEDSLRRYHRTAQQRTSSQSSIESIPRTTSKIAAATTTSTSTSLITTRIKRGTVATKSSESKSSSATTASSSRKRENGNGSDASRRIHRVCSRERMQKSNASSSESDLPNSSAEAPRRPRRTKVVKHHQQQRGEDEKKSISSRTTTIETSSSSPKKFSSSGKASSDGKVRLSTNKSTSSSVNPNSSLSSPSNPISSSRKSSRR